MNSLLKPKIAFRGDASGNVAVTFGLLLTLLLVGSGAAVDFGRWHMAKTSTMSALDAAVLAGGRALQLDPENSGAALAVARRYYDENVRNRLTLSDDTVDFVITRQSARDRGNGCGAHRNHPAGARGHRPAARCQPQRGAPAQGQGVRRRERRLEHRGGIGPRRHGLHVRGRCGSLHVQREAYRPQGGRERPDRHRRLGRSIQPDVARGAGAVLDARACGTGW